MTPSGRILSRYTADIGAIDLQLAFEGDNFCQIITMTLSLAGMIIAQVPLMTPVVVVAALVFTLSTVATDRANREVRRMANNSAAPVISRAHEMRAGGTLIRAMRLEPFFARRSAEAIDEWSRFLYLSKAIQHWANHITNYICVTIGLSVALYLMGTRDGGRLSTRGNRRRSDKGPSEG